LTLPVRRAIIESNFMIEVLKLGKKYNSELEQFLVNKNNLYITREGKRHRIKTLKDFKVLLRECSYSIRKYQGSTTSAILLVWKSDYQGIKRNYIKIEYTNLVDVDDLLMVLNWQFPKEIYVKLEKASPAIQCFRRKGFRFCTERGNEVLLFREKNDRRFIPPTKGDEELLEEETDERFINNY
jgi:hypothetical protein